MIYLGSKKRLASKLWETIKANVPITEDTHFVDLFCGGCGMVSQIPLKNRIANDLSTPLIAYLKKIQEDVEWMPKESFLTKEKYNYIKKHKELYKDFFLGYIGYNFSFGGSYFQGFRKEQGYSHALSTYKTAKKDSETLKDVKFYNMDYRDVPIPPHSIVYCDIPYRDTVGYNAVESFDYEAFYEYARKLKEQGHYVFISEFDQDMPKDFKLVGTYERKSNLKKIGKNRKGTTWKKDLTK